MPPYICIKSLVIITFPIINQTSSKFTSSVKAAILLQFDHSNKQKLAKYYDYSHCMHVKFGDDNLNSIAVIGRTIFVKIGCGGHLVYQKLLKINTSQAYIRIITNPYQFFIFFYVGNSMKREENMKYWKKKYF